MDNQTIQVIRASFPLVCIVVAGLLCLVKPDSTVIVQTLLTMGGVAHQSADTKQKDS